jgi:nicotinamidase-related amidase
MTMLDLTNAVLLPIDMQRAFDAKPWPNRWNKDIDTNGRAVLDAWRQSGRHVVHARHDSVQPGSTLAAGQIGNQFRNGFEPLPGERVVSKSVNSAFIATDLDLHLRRIGAKTIVTFGISTDMCVSTTIRTGSNMGWSMILVEDACDCFDLPQRTPQRTGVTIPAQQVHDVHVATLGFEFCKVVTTAELLAQLSQLKN